MFEFNLTDINLSRNGNVNILVRIIEICNFFCKKLENLKENKRYIKEYTKMEKLDKFYI